MSSGGAAVPEERPAGPGRFDELRPLWVLMATVFVDMVGFTIVLPLLPFYAQRMGAEPWLIGVLVAAYASAQLATSPLWGRFSDSLGRRPMILLGLSLSAVAYVLFGLADSIFVLFLCRLVQGAGGGIVGVVQAYVADTVEEADRAKALGWITAATSAGVMVGPALGSLATLWGPWAPGFLAAGLLALNTLSAWKWLPEPVRRDGSIRSRTPPPRGTVRRMIVDVLRRPSAPISQPVWMYTLGMMAFMAMNAVLALFLAVRFQVTEQSIGWFYVWVGAISVVMRALLLGPVVRRVGEVGSVALGTLSLAIGLAVMPFATGVRTLALAVIFIPVGTALLFPATTALVSRRAPRVLTGQALGVQQTFGGVSRLLGPLWAGALFQLGPSIPFWTGSALMFAVALWARRLRTPTAVANTAAIEVAAEAAVERVEAAGQPEART